MTSSIFEVWIRKVDKMYQRKKRKIVIITDNCPSHPNIAGLKTVKLLFLPPKTVAKLQPMDQGVIRNLKTHYRRQLISQVIKAINKKQKYNPTLLEVMFMMKKAWKMVTEATIANCFYRTGFKLIMTAQDVEKEEEQGEVNQPDDETLFAQLREAGMEIPAEITMETYAEMDDAIRCTWELTDDIILDAVHSSPEEVEKSDECLPARPPVSLADASKALEMLCDFALQHENTENMFDCIEDMADCVAHVQNQHAKQKKIMECF
ncbi:tigger transposable element-derived protein 4-like [Carcharodon carcharias]|uniref:tigger transposable element-derived protein 4-like n=1 Tax=Carcharodon carcharias TaxID=13397 RepID=UPI001B7F4B01|nr:tigger transposable element-derived protein 4-like [Carcharodon carcharias]